MLKGNLSTRPFYNDRLVTLLIVLTAAASLALAAFNTRSLLRFSGERGRRVSARQAAEADAVRIRADADRVQKSVDPVALRELGAATHEANALIDQRMFSWTVFFGLLENTLPLDVRVVAVAPRVERGVFQIDMIVNAKRPEDLSTFLDALQGTGSFYEVLAPSQQQNDDGTYNATVSASYLAPVIRSVKAAGATGGAAQR